MAEAATTPLGRAADWFETAFFPFVFVGLAMKDAGVLWRDWPAILPALADIDPLDLNVGDFVTVASVLMRVYLVVISLLSAVLLLRRSGTAKRTPDNWKEIVIPILATFGVMANSLLIDFFPKSLDRMILPDSARAAATVAGSLVVLLGLWMGITAEWTLNTSYGVFVQVRDPVMTGLYAHVRHPLYASYFLVNLGIFLLNPVLSYLILQVAYLSLLIYRARLEEAKLSDYSDEYREYKERTPMIVPRLWVAKKRPKSP
jgi:protein-S-isoprenylcysteine O-methyltransferase Ste14